MSKYIEVRNKNKNLCIDDTFKNLVVSRKLNINDIPTTEDRNAFISPWQDLTVGKMHFKKFDFLSNEYPIIALYTPKLRMEALYHRPIFARDYYGNLFATTYDGYDYSGVNFATFKDLTYNPDTKCGLQIFNSKGDIVFDANEQYFEVIGYASGNDISEYVYYIRDSIAFCPKIDTYMSGSAAQWELIQWYIAYYNNRSYLATCAPAGLTVPWFRNYPFPAIIFDENCLVNG